MPIAIIWFNFLLGSLSLQDVTPVPEPVQVNRGESPLSINAYLQAYKTDQDLRPEEVLARIEGGQMDVAESTVSPGFSTSHYWLYFSLQNKAGESLYLELNNPHLDYIDFYRVNGKEPLLLCSTGDKRIFASRDVSNRRFVFDLGQSSYEEYLIMVDKRGASISFPLKVWTQSAFTSQEYDANVLLGIYLGIVFFVGFFSLISGATLRNGIFLSYGVYVAFFALYIFTNLGFSFQYFYPNSAVLNSYSRILLATIMVISAADFFRRFLNVDLYLPKVAKVFRWIIVGLICLMVTGLIDRQFSPSHASLTPLLLRVLYLVIFGIIVLSIYIAITTWHKQRGTSLLFLGAFSSLIIGSGIFILIEFGVLPESNFPISPILIGSIFEILILSASMVYRVKYINDKKNELTQKIAQQQKELMKAFVTGGEKERSRISAELHDNIGSNLSLLKARISRSKLTGSTLTEDIDRLCEDVRNLSHQLMPHEMEITGIESTLKNYCKKFQKDTGLVIELSFYSVPRLGKEISFQLYRIIQEALQNTWKHARATMVEIQLIGYEGEVVVTIDDNGVGFDLSHYQEGNGLLNMRSRVEATEGTMEVSSYPGKGTNLLFKVPLPATE